MPRCNPPNTVPLPGSALLASWIATTTLNICENNGDSVSLTGDLLRRGWCEWLRLPPMRAASEEQGQQDKKVEQCSHARELG